MRLRTMRQAHNELLAADPGCCLTYRNLLDKVKSGEWPSQKFGKRFYVDLDWIEDQIYQTRTDNSKRRVTK